MRIRAVTWTNALPQAMAFEPRCSARHAWSLGGHIVEGEGHRYAGVVAQQGDHIGDADMAEGLDRAVVEPLRNPARIGERHRDLVDDLLPLVGERGPQAGDERFDLIGWQPNLLAAPLMRARRVSRMPFAVNDADCDLALAFGQRVVAGMEMSAERRRCFGQLGVMHPDLARPADLTTGVDHKAIALLLLRRHLFIGDLDVTAEGRPIRHFGLPSRVDGGASCNGRACLSTWRGAAAGFGDPLASRAGLSAWLQSV